MDDTLLDKAASPRIALIVKCAFWIAFAVSAVFAYRFWPDAETWKLALTTETAVGGLLCFALQFMAILLRGIRWRVFLQPVAQVPIFRITSVFAWCFFLGGVFPYRLGEAARLIWNTRFGSSMGFGLGTLAIERILDLAAIILIAGVVVAMLANAPDWMRGWVDFYFVAVLLGCAALAVLAVPMASWLRNLASKNRSGLTVFIANIATGLEIVRTPGRLGAVIGLTGMVWVIFVVSCHVYLARFFPGFSWPESAALAVVVTLSAIVPLTPGNLGAFEASAVILLSALGYDEARALVAAATLHGILLLSVTVFGGLGWLLEVRGDRTPDLLE